MKTLRALAEVSRACAEASAGGMLGFVPTMGAIHEGHLSLVRQARQRDQTVVASIFVNPMQFGPGEDLGSYPRREQADADLLAAQGVDLLLLLDRDEMYPPAFATRVEVAEFTGVLEGACRPGHFTGVVTVVAKLLNLVRPQRAYFGRKDYQQSVVVRRMVADLNVPTEVVVCDTVREPDGLALSSRNVYLGPEDRRAARSLVAALLRSQKLFDAGERSAAALERAMAAILEEGTGRSPDYAVVADPWDLSRRPEARPGDVTLVACRVGPARLIDNHVLGATLGPFPEGAQKRP